MFLGTKRRWFLLIGFGLVVIVTAYLFCSTNNEAQKEKTQTVKQASAQKEIKDQDHSKNSLPTKTETVSASATFDQDMSFIDDDVIKQAEAKAADAFYDAKYRDPREFVKKKWRHGMSYEESRRLITKDKLPLLYKMLEDKKYAPYWHCVADVPALIFGNFFLRIGLG